MDPDAFVPAPPPAPRYCWRPLRRPGLVAVLISGLLRTASGAPGPTAPTQQTEPERGRGATVAAPEGTHKIAKPPRNKFDLLYVAPSECPTRQEFVGWTNQFYQGTDEGTAPTDTESAENWQASPGEIAGSVRIKVVGDGDEYTAHLVMVDAEGQCPTSRPPHTETACADAVRAMAYSLAQALKAPPCADAAEGAAPSEIGAKPCPPPARAREPATPSTTKPRSTEEPLRGEVGLGAGLVAPLAENIAWGGTLFVGFLSPDTNLSGRLTAGYWNAGRVPIGYALDAELWSLTAAICPLALELNRWLTLPFCATAELGTVALSGVGSSTEADASGDGSTSAGDNDRANLYLWSSLGVAPRLRLERRWLFAEIEPNLVFPLLRHPVYVHQPGNETSERENAGQVGGWVALKAHLNVGIVFP